MTTGFVIDRDVEIPMRDGVVLRADVWRAPGELRPVILFRTPYDKSAMKLEPLSPERCVRHGYAAVVQDTRGRFASDGEWHTRMWETEGLDTYDTVEWVAGQEWCDGQVGMTGPSYLGIVQWLGAMRRPPHLKAIAPAMATSAEYDRQATGGALRLSHIVGWLGFMAVDWMQRQLAAGQVSDFSAIARFLKSPHEQLRLLPLERILDTPGCPVSMTEVLDGGLESAPHIRTQDTDLPTLSLTGWFDVFSSPTIALFGEVAEREPGRHQLIVGPWTHSAVLPQYQGELNFGLGAASEYAQTADELLAFFGTHLKGASSAGEPAGEPEAPVRYFMMGANEWRTARSWPPASASPQLWYLREGGRLAMDPPQDDEPADTYIYDPHDPAPSHGGRLLNLGELVGGPLNQRHLEERADTLVFTGPILDEPVETAGHITASLSFASSALDTDLVVKLTDVFPDGRSVLVCDGALRTRYREGFDAEKLLTPSVAESCTVDLGHTAWRFAAGHRIRLLVTSSNFPHLDRNLNTGRPVGKSTEAVLAQQSVFHDAARQSRLELPVLTPLADR
ncbi:CocE/NonD family hydrolase [Streptomyces gobiensis]|uniref:CocE/NonD family hydrolase n=1 Tax=Streptomyces gobiensis TaxID=2875706 RepID=UPI001E479A67|nr:CocE/NonD family hydrolase [Streptomyces gobiensis]UGY94142.1 CocE/NonD family hydrolase [Streptomyces gobiensis]